MTQGRNLRLSPTCICVHPGSQSHLYPGRPVVTVQFPFPHATVLHSDPMTGARRGLRGEKKSAAAGLAVMARRRSTSAAPPASRLILVS